MTVTTRAYPCGDDEARVVVFADACPVGDMIIGADGVAGFAGQLRCAVARAPCVCVTLIVAAAEYLVGTFGAKGVIIYTEGKNQNRAFYKRLRFVDVHGVEGAKSARLCDVIEAGRKVLQRHG